MADGNQEAQLEFEPVNVSESEIIIPLTQVEETPYEPFEPYIVESAKKGLIVNIETSGLNPWEHRIIAIGLQDPQDVSGVPTVLLEDSEYAMIVKLFAIIKAGSYNQLIGYGCGFDFRFLLLKSMYYNIDCLEFYEMALLDLMQAVGQGKFEYVYYAPKPPSLSDISDFFFSYPKQFSDLEMLKYWKSGDVEKVYEFASSQITRIWMLYMLFSKISQFPFTELSSGGGAEQGSSSTTEADNTGSKLTIPEASQPELNKIQCKECLQEHFYYGKDRPEVCTICGAKLK